MAFKRHKSWRMECKVFRWVFGNRMMGSWRVLLGHTGSLDQYLSLLLVAENESMDCCPYVSDGRSTHPHLRATRYKSDDRKINLNREIDVK